MTIHSLIQEGDVVASGVFVQPVSGRHNPYSLVYSPKREAGTMVICPPDIVDHMEKLGFTIHDHWITSTHRKGFRGVEFCHLSDDARPLSPGPLAALNGGALTNQAISHVLEKEEHQ